MNDVLILCLLYIRSLSIFRRPSYLLVCISTKSSISFVYALLHIIATQAFLFYGIAAAVASLAVVCVLFFRVGMRLPLSLFFRVTSLVLLVLSVVLLGRGIAALQEAGVLSAYYLGVPTIEWLGFFPTVQGVAAQVLAVLLGVVLWLRGNHRQEGR